MKPLAILEHKGFRTSFFIMPKTEKFLSDKGVIAKALIPSAFDWYESFLFELLNPDLNESWTAEKEQRKAFKVVLYGITEKLTEKENQGFSEDPCLPETILTDSLLPVSQNSPPFAVRQRVFVM